MDIKNSILISAIAISSTLLGIIVGALINHVLEKNRRKGELFFEARKNVYGKFIGHARCLIMEEFSDKNKKEFIGIASEAVLFSSINLRKRLNDFLNLIHKKTETRGLRGIDTVTYTTIDKDILLDNLKNVELSMKEELGIK